MCQIIGQHHCHGIPKFDAVVEIILLVGLEFATRLHIFEILNLLDHALVVMDQDVLKQLVGGVVGDGDGGHGDVLGSVMGAEHCTQGFSGAKGAPTVAAVRTLVVPDSTANAIHGEAPGIPDLVGIVSQIGLESQDTTDISVGEILEATGAAITELINLSLIHI